MRFLILAHAGDTTAARVGAILRERHTPADVRVVCMHDLALAPRFSHVLDEDRAETHIQLRDGTRIRSDAVGIVLNRLQYVQVPQFQRSNAADRDYASMEMFALLLSWLESLPGPVINPGSSAGLGGPARHPLEWFKLASEAGLRTLRLCLTSSPRRFPAPGLCPVEQFSPTRFGESMSPPQVVLNRPGWFIEVVGVRDASLLLVGDQLFGNLPANTHEPSLRLAQKAGLSFARFFFSASARARDEWVFTGTDLWPDVVERRQLEALACFLETKSLTA
jgi:hypothetical protein